MCALWDHLNMHGSDLGVYTATEHNIPVLHTGSSIRDLTNTGNLKNVRCAEDMSMIWVHECTSYHTLLSP